MVSMVGGERGGRERGRERGGICSVGAQMRRVRLGQSRQINDLWVRVEFEQGGGRGGQRWMGWGGG